MTHPLPGRLVSAMGLENSGHVTLLRCSPNLRSPLVWKAVMDALHKALSFLCNSFSHNPVGKAGHKLCLRAAANRLRHHLQRRGKDAPFVAGAIHSSFYSCDPVLLVLNKADGSFLLHPQAVKQVTLCINSNSFIPQPFQATLL